MQWTVQVTVALLNILWVVFFLTPDPFSVSVQRRSARSSEEETPFQEFCVEPESHMNRTSTPPSVTITTNKANSIDTAAGVNQESNSTAHEVHSIKTNIQHDCQCNYTNILPTDWSSSHREFRPPAPGCEPMMIMTFPDIEVCMDAKLYFSATTPLTTDWEETAAVSLPPVPELTSAASPPVQGPASSEVTAASGLVAQSASAAPLYTAPHHPRTPIRQKDSWDRRKITGQSESVGPDDCCFKLYPRRLNKNLIKSYYLTDARCLKTAVILVTLKSRQICADPNLSWVDNIMKSIDESTNPFKPTAPESH